MSVDDLYKIAQDIINKNQNGYLSPDEFNRLINQAQTSFLDYLLGEFQQYQYQRAIARVQYSNNSITRQRLQPYIYGINLNIDGTGFSPYPGDFQQTDAMWTMYGFNRIRYTQQDSLYSYYNSKIDPISTNPIFLTEDQGFRFYPSNLLQARLSYVKTPNRIFWAFTLDGNGQPVYDPINSEQPRWYETDLLEILVRLLAMVGIKLQAAEVMQYSQQIKTQGQ